MGIRALGGETVCEREMSAAWPYVLCSKRATCSGTGLVLTLETCEVERRDSEGLLLPGMARDKTLLSRAVYS